MDIDKSDQQRIAETLRKHATQDVVGTLDPWPAILERFNSASANRTGDLHESTAVPRQAGPHDPWLPRRLFERPSGSSAQGGSPNRFALGTVILAICMVVFAVMVILPPAGLPPNATSASSFVPPGKVRHEVFSDTETSSATSFVTTTTNAREVWLTNGKSHLLVRDNKDQKGDYWLLGETTVWSYNPSIVPTIVYTYPYDPKELKDFLPDSQVVTKTQQEVGTHVVGADVIQGRPAILIERTNNITPGSPIDQTSGGIQRYRFWIDTNTYQVIQWEYDKRESANEVYTDKVDTSRVTMTLDELLNADQVPPDLFAFVQPSGTWVIRDPSVSYGP